MRYSANQRDANEAGVVKALRAAGAYVFLLSGKGVPDLLVGYRGSTFAIEVKNPNSKGGAEPGGKRTPGRGRLKPAQVKAFAAWTGDKIHVVISADEALAAIGVFGGVFGRRV